MPEEDEVSLYDYIKVISKRKWLIVIGTFACILTAAIVTLLLPRVYETRATLTMLGPDTPDVKIGALNIPTGLSLGKFFNFLPHNKDLNLEVIRKLGLDKSPDEFTPQALNQMITFSLAKTSRTITINVRYSHAQKTRNIADTMAEAMKEKYQVLNEAEISQSQNLIDEQLNLIEVSLGEAKKNLEETIHIDSLREEIKTRSSEETWLAQEHLEVKISLVEQEARLAKAKEELQKQDRLYVLSQSIVEDPAYEGVLDKLSKEDMLALQRVKSEGQQINPVYLNLEQTVTNARISIAGGKAKESLIKQKIEENRLALSRLWTQLAEREPEWETLTEGYDLARKEYRSIRTAHQKAVELLAAAKTRQLRTVATAGVPSKPIEPNTKRIILIAAAVGLLATLFLAFFLEYLAKMKKLETESKKQEN